MQKRILTVVFAELVVILLIAVLFLYFAYYASKPMPVFLAPEISFVQFNEPTPADNTKITSTTAEINVSINKEISEFKFNWNNTNYSFYDDSLILMYNFDKVSGLEENDTYVVDVSREEANNAFAENGTTWTSSGKFGGAFEFDGVDDLIERVAAYSLMPRNGITASAWTKFSSKQDGGFIMHMKGANNYLLWMPAGYYEAFITVGGVVYTARDSNLPSLNQWHFTVMTYNGEILNLYVDKVLVASNDAMSGDITYGGVEYWFLGIGAYAANSLFFNGTIDEIRIYNTSLSAEEIKQHYFSNLKKYDAEKWEFYSRQENLQDSSYNYQAFAKDMDGENSTEIRTLTIDTTSPLIEYGAGTPDNSATLIQKNLFVNVSIIEENEDAIIFYLYNSTMKDINATTFTDKTRNINFTNLAYGTYYYNVSVNDTAGNFNSIALRSVTLFENATLPDTENPEINLISPQNNYSTTLREITFFYNVSDASDITNCKLILDSGVVEINNRITKLVQTFTRNLAEGRHTWQINCTDIAGNKGSSGINTITIGQAELRVCNELQEKCISGNFYLCINNSWLSKGKVSGKCGYVVVEEEDTTFTQEDYREISHKDTLKDEKKQIKGGKIVFYLFVFLLLVMIFVVFFFLVLSLRKSRKEEGISNSKLLPIPKAF